MRLPSYEWLAVQDDCRVYDTSDAAAFIAECRHDFGDDVLAKLEVCRRSPAGTVVPHPMFDGGDCSAVCVVLRDKEGCSRELLTQYGTLSGLPSIYLCGLDRATRRAFSASRRSVVHVVFDIRDFVLLRSLKVPVTLADGLDCLAPDHLGVLAYWVGVTSSRHLPVRLISDDHAWEAHATYFVPPSGRLPNFDLLLHGWSPANPETVRGVEFPAGFDSVIRFLEGTSRLFDLEWEHLAVACPTLTLRQGWEYARRQRSAVLLQKLFSDAAAAHDQQLFDLFELSQLIGHRRPPEAPQRQPVAGQCRCPVTTRRNAAVTTLATL